MLPFEWIEFIEFGAEYSKRVLLFDEDYSVNFFPSASPPNDRMMSCIWLACRLGDSKVSGKFFIKRLLIKVAKLQRTIKLFGLLSSLWIAFDTGKPFEHHSNYYKLKIGSANY